MKKIIKFIIIILLSISINQIGTAQSCEGPFVVDLSGGGDHTIDDILQQLGINTLDELCNYGQQYDMVIGGTLILNNQDEEICFDGIDIKMLKGSSISVRSNTTLTLNYVRIYGCGTVWKGINVGHSTINVTGGSIEDAGRAIWAGNKATVNIKDAIFKNNSVSIDLGLPGNGNTDILSVEGTTFTSDDSFSDDEGTIPLIGIVMSGQDYVIIASEVGNENTFENLNQGIFVWHSKAKIENCIFKNIHESSLGSRGIGIDILNHSYGGDGVSNISNNTFLNVDTGLRAKGGIEANNNNMEDVKKGIIIRQSTLVNIERNIIEATDIGIGINYCNGGGSPVPFKVESNEITISNNNTAAKAINIQASNYFRVIDNDIILHANEAGIFVRKSDYAQIEENSISVQGFGGINTDAIHLESSEFVEVNDNDMTDYGPGCNEENIGIFSNTSFGTFACNKTHNFKYGMNFFDDCDDSRLDGNRFYNNSRDLVLGNAIVSSVTVIGKQGNFDDLKGWGNKWYSNNGGTAYNYSPLEFVEDSKFLVNSVENSKYKPQFIYAAGNDWFEDDSDATNKSSCTNSPDDPPIGPVDCSELIEKILKIDTTSEMDDCKKAMWKYNYFKKLLMLKKNNLLIGDCLTFFDNNGDNVLIEIAKVDSAIVGILDQQSVDSVMYNNLVNTQTELDNMYDQGNANTVIWDETMTLYNQLQSDYNTILEAEKISNDQKVDSIKNIITTITISDSCLKVLVKTFEIELDYIKNDSLTPSQFTYVKDVAESCPSEFGDGVYVARSMMSRYENIRYASIEDCGTPIEIEPRGTLKGVETEMQLYPNPATDVVSISIDVSEDEIGELTIVDIRGKVLNSFIINDKNRKFKINVSKFANGIYLVKYKSNKGKQSVEKLMISK